MKDNDIEEFMSNFIKNSTEEYITEEEKEFIKYCKLFKERFGRNAYIAEPSGTREDTIKAIKICLDKDKDILDDLLYPNIKKDYIL